MYEGGEGNSKYGGNIWVLKKALIFKIIVGDYALPDFKLWQHHQSWKSYSVSMSFTGGHLFILTSGFYFFVPHLLVTLTYMH